MWSESSSVSTVNLAKTLLLFQRYLIFPRGLLFGVPCMCLYDCELKLELVFLYGFNVTFGPVTCTINKFQSAWFLCGRRGCVWYIYKLILLENIWWPVFNFFGLYYFIHV